MSRWGQTGKLSETIGEPAAEYKQCQPPTKKSWKTSPLPHMLQGGNSRRCWLGGGWCFTCRRRLLLHENSIDHIPLDQCFGGCVAVPRCIPFVMPCRLTSLCIAKTHSSQERGELKQRVVRPIKKFVLADQPSIDAKRSTERAQRRIFLDQGLGHHVPGHRGGLDDEAACICRASKQLEHNPFLRLRRWLWPWWWCRRRAAARRVGSVHDRRVQEALGSGDSGGRRTGQLCGRLA
mmetsp:Transcript_78704/g.218639  ORF Transcript_78704/g.218639 Transcript_78704/m.218639 type:complete len:235 (-) Transcript_78704:856-1560(-)